MALVRRARKQYLRAHFPLRRRIDCRCGNIRVGPNDGVKITCHPDADPTSPTSYLMPSVNPTTTCLMTATDLTTCCLMISGDPTNYPICPTMRCYHFAMRLVVPIATALRHASYHMLLSHLRHASYHFAMRGWNRWIRRCGRSTGARGS